MRALIVMSLVAAGLALTACEKKAEEAAAPEAPKYAGRSQQMYQGQEHLLKVHSATVTKGANPGELVLTASADAPGGGYTNLGFLPRIYAAQPKDGVYEVDVVGDKPAAGDAAVTTLEIKGGWSRYSDDRVKGITFIGKDNSVTAMVQ